jgi:hypothetical protein
LAGGIHAARGPASQSNLDAMHNFFQKNEQKKSGLL